MTLSNIPGPDASAPLENSKIAANPSASYSDFPIPAYSSWFGFGGVHEIERRAFPEFFQEEANSPFFSPQVYQEYRDFMIHSFRMRPSEYLSVTVCRRHLAGDVTVIMKIHAFLEQWGLINYQVTENSSTAPSTFVAATVQAHKATLPASLDAFLKSEAGTGLLKCGACEADCTALYYHSPAGRLNLCPGCFTSGQYGSELASHDFIKIDTGSFSAASGSSTGSAEWTDEETLRLLEAVEKYSDSGVNMAANNVWDAIAESVGRPREACLLQFLRLPVSESLQAQPGIIGMSASMVAFPFGESENPVLSVVAFLAANVHPRVAAVASQAALAEMSKLNEMGNTQLGNTTMVNTQPSNTSTSSSTTNTPLNTATNQVAAVALASAAAHAQSLAKAEEERLQYWRDCLLETQLKKLQLKMDSLDELERIVEEDRKMVAEQRLQIFMERYNLRKMMIQYERSVKE